MNSRPSTCETGLALASSGRVQEWLSFVLSSCDFMQQPTALLELLVGQPLRGAFLKIGYAGVLGQYRNDDLEELDGVLIAHAADRLRSVFEPAFIKVRDECFPKFVPRTLRPAFGVAASTRLKGDQIPLFSLCISRGW